MKKIALLSVSDKTGLEILAEALISNNYEILSTGGTARALRSSNIQVTEISDFTGYPEVFSGRVKTLHPKVHGGILMRLENKNDIAEADKNGIKPIDVVCVNLYPFPQLVNNTEIITEEKIENIDIGGPTLIRASAKNYKYVSVLTNPEQYEKFIFQLNAGGISEEYRQELAGEAFAHTSFYDTIIADYFENNFGLENKYFRLNKKLNQSLRYGENPHQEARLFGDFDEYFNVLHGKELSYNNIVDLNAAVDLVKELPGYSCAVIKHTNPCGAAEGSTLFEAYEKALSCDPVSAFGGIVAFNSEVDVTLAEKLNEIFLEIVSAPSFTEQALEILRKKKNRRIVTFNKKNDNSPLIKTVPGGILIQDKDNSSVEKIDLKTVSQKKCSDSELEELKFAWIVCKHTKSNAIVFVKDKKAVGVGAGQMSRLDSVKIAAAKAKTFGHDLNGAVAASDAFFPFPDGVEEIISHGINAVIQPGGSVRDNEVIDAVNNKNAAMIFTGIRNFKH